MDPAHHTLYEIDVGDTYRSRFAYASGYTPLPDRKSFVPPSCVERNREFIAINGFRPGIRMSGEGSKWPDFLFNGCGYVSFFVSERVVSDLRAEGFEVLDATEFPIESIEARRTKLRAEDAPRYFVIEACPELVPDWPAMNIPTGPDGRPILSPLPKGWPPRPFRYRKDSWSGRSLISTQADTTALHCSISLKKYAEKCRWTNVVFRDIGSYPFYRPDSCS